METVQKGRGTGIITDLTCCHEEVQWTSVPVGDGMHRQSDLGMVEAIGRCCASLPVNADGVLGTGTSA
ncbi:hypothetical protein AA101099_0519 [Neoasaia chiangmaiensis NBRC 101099]|nr:hypothetical protein AA101099_0519 [Neoasaia chiangmaiensis NBRC 101099]GEN16591.1 hypothetical protein NCH01_30220 [Neoasaia chiangmaiensis]